MVEREESDQLPEEGPEQQVPEDEESSGSSRSEASESAGGAEGEDEDEGQDTGNPASAG
jgi:hypothetical protein